MESKSILLSKTFWVNVISPAVTIGGVFGLTDIPADQQAELAVGIVALLNIIMRLVTKQPVHIVKPEE